VRLCIRGTAERATASATATRKRVLITYQPKHPSDTILQGRVFYPVLTLKRGGGHILLLILYKTNFAFIIFSHRETPDYIIANIFAKTGGGRSVLL
jgi:hypothetical protein